jgi:hypothetical protein
MYHKIFSTASLLVTAGRRREQLYGSAAAQLGDSLKVYAQAQTFVLISQ